MRVTGELNTGPWGEIDKSAPTWVPAPTQKRPNPVVYPVGEYSGVLTDSHLASLETIRETSTPFDRALGLVVRTAPFASIWLVLAMALMISLDSDWPLPFLGFATLTAITYYLLNGQEYRHSAVGLERHKADLAHDLQVRKLDGDQAARDKALDAYIRHLEKDR